MRSLLVFTLQAALVGLLIVIPKATLGNRWSFVPVPWWKFLINHQLAILFLLAAGNLFINTFPKVFMEPRRKKQKIRAAILSTMKSDVFGDDKPGEEKHLRITIFTPPGIFSSIIIWFRVWWGETARRFRGRRGELRLRYRKMARYRFIRPLQRLGTRYPTAKTHFFYNLDDDELCEGVVGQVMQSRAVIKKRDLKPPSHEDLRGLRREDRAPEKVARYLNETNATLRTLRRLNDKSRHFYGQPIENRETSKIVGVLIVDSTKLDSPFEKATTPSKIAKYANMLYETL